MSIIVIYRCSIDTGKKRSFAYGICPGDYPVQKINCFVCGRQWDKSLLLDEQAQLTVLLSNQYFPDFLGYIYHKLISEKAKAVFLQESISGYHLGTISVLPIDEISKEEKRELRQLGYKVNKIPVDPPNYFRLFIDGVAELHEKSNMVLVGECVVCGYKKYRRKDNSFLSPLYIKNGSWDGSDLFCVKEFPAVIFCSERFFNIYRKYNLTGLLFNEIEYI